MRSFSPRTRGSRSRISASGRVRASSCTPWRGRKKLHQASSVRSFSTTDVDFIAGRRVYTAHPMRATVEWLLTALEAGLWLLLVAASLHLLRSALWALGQPPLQAGAAPPIPAAAPPV